MNNTTAIAASNPTISYHRLSKVEGIAAIFLRFYCGLFLHRRWELCHNGTICIKQETSQEKSFLSHKMAASDLLRVAVSLPMFLFVHGYYFRLGKVKTNQYFSFSFTFVETFISQVSVISAVSISLERFHAICWPFRHRVLSTRTYKICIFITWALAFFVSSILTLFVWFRDVKSFVYVWMT